MTHEFPLPPSANQYWRHVGSKVLVSAAAKAYKHTIGMLALCDRVQRLDGPIAVTVHVYRQRRSGDLDNFLKILLDSMQGVFFNNDSQVVEIHAYLHDDKHAPRCEVEVTAIPVAPKPSIASQVIALAETGMAEEVAAVLAAGKKCV